MNIFLKKSIRIYSLTCGIIIFWKDLWNFRIGIGTGFVERKKSAQSYKSHFSFQALGSFYFIHESLKSIQQFDFKGECPFSHSHPPPPNTHPDIHHHHCLEMKSSHGAPSSHPFRSTHNHLQAIPTSIKTSPLRLALRIM